MFPGAPLTNFNDGRSNRGSYFIPKKITTSEFVYPKKSLLFLAYPKKNPFISPFSVFNFSKICCNFVQNRIFENPRWWTCCAMTVAIATVLN